MKKITIYTGPNCPYCTAANNLLTQREVPYTEIPLGRDEHEKRSELFKRSGMKTVPQIFSDDTLIGGFSDLEKLDQVDKLESLKS